MFNPTGMTQVSYQSTIVQYFKYKIEVPIWAKYLATDFDGKVYAYKSRPSAGYKEWVADSVHSPVEIMTMSYEGDWKDSLVMVNNV